MFLENVGRRRMELQKSTIGAVLGAKQEAVGIPYAALSRRTGINDDMISRFCHGSSMPKGSQLLLLCRELNLDVDDFFNFQKVK